MQSGNLDKPVINQRVLIKYSQSVGTVVGISQSSLGEEVEISEFRNRRWLRNYLLSSIDFAPQFEGPMFAIMQDEGIMTFQVQEPIPDWMRSELEPNLLKGLAYYRSFSMKNPEGVNAWVRPESLMPITPEQFEDARVLNWCGVSVPRIDRLSDLGL